MFNKDEEKIKEKYISSLSGKYKNYKYTGCFRTALIHPPKKKQQKNNNKPKTVQH